MERLELEQHRLIALIEGALRAGHTEEEIVALVDESLSPDDLPTEIVERAA